MAAFLLRGSHNNINWIATEVPYAIVHVFFSVIVAYATIIVALALRGRRMLSSRDAGQDGWPYILALLWLGTPIILPLIVSVVAKPVFDPRYASVGIPAIALLAGAFVSQAPGGWGGIERSPSLPSSRRWSCSAIGRISHTSIRRTGGVPRSRCSPQPRQGT